MTEYIDMARTGYDLYKCECCGAIFETPEIETKRVHYTVGDSDRYAFIEGECCPECGSFDIDSYEQEEEE